MARRNADAAVAVQFHHRRGANQLQLQAAVGALGTRQLADLVPDPLPLVFGVQVQAAGLERVVGDDQPVAALARDQVAVSGGHR